MEMGLDNFSVLSLHKVVPPALEVLFSDPEIRVDGLICPGHVSAVIGFGALSESWPKNIHKPCVVTGFETQDVLEGIVMLLRQLHKGEAEVEIQYRRVVKKEGNLVAQATLAQGISNRGSALARAGIHSRKRSGTGTGLCEDGCAQKILRCAKLKMYLLKGCACGKYWPAR